MEYLKALAEFGVWSAIYPMGVWTLALVGHDALRPLRSSPLSVICVGSASLTLLLMALAVSGIFVPVAIGAAGWAVLACWSWGARPWNKIVAAGKNWKAILLSFRFRMILIAAIVAAAGFLYAFFPKESLLGERDEGIYAQHALHLLRTGGSAIDLERMGLAREPGILAIAQGRAAELPGIYPTGSHWTFQFSAATPVWMTMLASLLGPMGIFRFNALLGIANCLAFYALAARFLPPGRRLWAVAALAVFAFQPAQVWVSRNTLSEPLCAWFLLNGVFTAMIALSRGSHAIGLVAGGLIGMATFVRIDAVVFPLAIAAASLALVAAGRLQRGSRVAAALHAVALGCYFVNAVALLYFGLFVRTYLTGLADLVVPAVAATALCGIATVLLGRHPGLRLSTRHAARLAWPVAIGFIAVFVYALWLRPDMQPYALIESKLVPQLNGTRDYREVSLINLSAYLSGAVVLMAGIGASLGLWLALRKKLSPANVWALLFLLIPMAVYLWRPMISPDHIWAARRWVPAVFPACILLAAFAASRLNAGLTRPQQSAVVVFSMVALTISLLSRQRETLFLREDAQMVAQIGAIAQALPTDRISYVVGSGPLTSALLTGFGRSVAQLTPAAPPYTAASLGLAASCTGPRRSCLIVHPRVQPIEGPQAQPLADAAIVRVRRNTAFVAPARGTHEERSEWRITRVGE
ncbi:hypothetical protein [Lysobacter sp. Hz 25]|uniref:hypothetical protein n=1 Tax=Lysobacter sp. Hz 25 TaxID=3383698 RepID=UPI0038D432F9